MNQRQIRYLDKRIQEEKDKLYFSLTEKYSKLKKSLLEGLTEEFKRAYMEKLALQPKEDLVRRLGIIMTCACRDYEDYGSYIRNGIIDLKDGSGNIGWSDSSGIDKADILEIDGFVSEWNRKAGDLERAMDRNKELAVARLEEETRALRDRINLGDASEAADSLEQFVAKWTKIIDDADKVPQTHGRDKDKTNRGKGRK